MCLLHMPGSWFLSLPRPLYLPRPRKKLDSQPGESWPRGCSQQQSKDESGCAEQGEALGWTLALFPLLHFQRGHDRQAGQTEWLEQPRRGQESRRWKPPTKSDTGELWKPKTGLSKRKQVGMGLGMSTEAAVR